MWHYQANNQAIGPVDDEKIKALIAEKTLIGTTLVWAEGMPEWLPLSQTPLASFLPVQPPPMSTGIPTPPSLPTPPPINFGTQQAPQNYPQGYYVAPPLSPAAQAQSLETLFKWFWILLAAGIPLCFLLIGIPAVIAACVLGYIMIYKYWEVIQNGSPRTTPGKAIGFMFIPFFNIYWQFVAIHGLAQDLNRYTRERGVSAPIANEQLALTLCILNCCGWIPYVGILTGIASLVIMILLMKDFKNTAVAILASRQ